ncbi:hypothetical protein V4R08_15830 (plasmid) [Nitrobacter sp. NHB1]|uniref:hypothetical protein n=1 Tax=Nitrobacter sp. NHB1 TaxID=3119830 RepID=UPI0030003D58
MREVIQRQTLVEALHLDGIFDRQPVAVDAERTVIALCDCDNAAVDLRRRWTIDLDLFFAGRLPFRQCGIIEKWKPDCALDLQCSVACKKNHGGMGVDAPNVGIAMCRGVGQEGKDFPLNGSFLRGRACHVRLWLELKNGCPQQLSCP